jgi:hypothetical protein
VGCRNLGVSGLGVPTYLVCALSINKARKFGWTGHMDSYEAFVKTFEKMKALKQIPA